MRRGLVAAVLTVLSGCNPVFAQVAGMGSPTSAIGATSPLGIGPSSPVPPTGLRLGTTEVPTRGVSPMNPAPSPTMRSLTSCGGIGGSIPEASFGVASSSTGTTSGMGTSSAGTAGSALLFDGGGTAGSASGTCGGAAGSSLAGPAASGSSSVGRIGIPLGATELGVGGVSAAPVVPMPSPYPSTTGIGAPTSSPYPSMTGIGGAPMSSPSPSTMGSGIQ
jgi:hypothetical protein